MGKTYRFFKRIMVVKKIFGIKGLLVLIKNQLPFSPRILDYQFYSKFFKGKSGLEIGGSSKIFQPFNLLPLYPIVKALDGCNFFTQTIWGGCLEEGQKYYYASNKTKGCQYVSEAGELKQIPEKKYDFVVSSHCLEHLANPLKALKEWIRILKPQGVILVVVPDKNGNFDHLRKVTSFEHLQQDFNQQTGEDDLSHLPEILKYHDLSLDRKVENQEVFHARSQKNFANRCLHHHVFGLPLLVKIFEELNLKVLKAENIPLEHNIIMGQKN